MGYEPPAPLLGAAHREASATAAQQARWNWELCFAIAFCPHVCAWRQHNAGSSKFCSASPRAQAQSTVLARALSPSTNSAPKVVRKVGELGKVVLFVVC